MPAAARGACGRAILPSSAFAKSEPNFAMFPGAFGAHLRSAARAALARRTHAHARQDRPGGPRPAECSLASPYALGLFTPAASCSGQIPRSCGNGMFRPRSLNPSLPGGWCRGARARSPEYWKARTTAKGRSVGACAKCMVLFADLCIVLHRPPPTRWPWWEIGGSPVRMVACRAAILRGWMRLSASGGELCKPLRVPRECTVRLDLRAHGLDQKVHVEQKLTIAGKEMGEYTALLPVPKADRSTLPNCSHTPTNSLAVSMYHDLSQRNSVPEFVTVAAACVGLLTRAAVIPSRIYGGPETAPCYGLTTTSGTVTRCSLCLSGTLWCHPSRPLRRRWGRRRHWRASPGHCH